MEPDTLWRIYEQDARFRAALDRAVGGITCDQLDALLDAQKYRLAYWRMASETINYRRFFDVSDLVGVRVENPEVFEARNRRTLDLIAEGKVTGLRIDHIDGLFDPISHMRKLQARLAESGSTNGQRPAANFYIIVEKILTDGEQLPGDAVLPDRFLQELHECEVGRKANLARATSWLGKGRLADAVRLLRETVESYPDAEEANRQMLEKEEAAAASA